MAGYESLARGQASKKGGRHMSPAMADGGQEPSGGSILEVNAFELAGTMLDAVPESQMPPDFGRYRIEKRLGKGGMGEVFLATDTAADRRVAIKFLRYPQGGADAAQHFTR